jgi:hypothetical protein
MIDMATSTPEQNKKVVVFVAGGIVGALLAWWLKKCPVTPPPGQD